MGVQNKLLAEILKPTNQYLLCLEILDNSWRFSIAMINIVACELSNKQKKCFVELDFGTKLLARDFLVEDPAPTDCSGLDCFLTACKAHLGKGHS